MTKNSEIDFYVDCLVAETVLSNSFLVKHAQSSAIMDFIEKVKSYFSSHIRPDDKLGSFVDFLGPTAAYMTFSALGMPWTAALVGLSMSVFDINISDIFKSVGEYLSPMVKADQEITSSTVDRIVNNAVDSAATKSSVMSSSPSTDSPEFSSAVGDLLSQVVKASPSQRLREAKIVKLTMIDYQNRLKYKKANPAVAAATRFGFVKVLKTIIGWYFKIGLGSLGFMVAGDAVNKMLGRGNAFDGSMKDGVRAPRSADQEPTTQLKSSKQKVFPANPSYSDVKERAGWSLSVRVNRETINRVLINFAKQVYQGLDDKESLILSSPSFKAVVDLISYYNRDNVDTNLLFIPTLFTSKKQIVDQFIDDVAEASKKSA